MQDRRWIGVLVLLLFFALFHTSQHDLDLDHGGGSVCQLCFLDHTPGAAVRELLASSPLFIAIALVSLYRSPLFFFSYFLVPLSRAPPIA